MTSTAPNPDPIALSNQFQKTYLFWNWFKSVQKNLKSLLESLKEAIDSFYIVPIGRILALDTSINRIDTFFILYNNVSNLLLVLFLLLVGWLISKFIVKVGVTKLLKMLKVDDLSSRLELDQILSKGGINNTLSELIGEICYFFISHFGADILKQFFFTFGKMNFVFIRFLFKISNN